MQENESFRLVMRRGPQPNQVYELNKDVITLGRDITNDIVINDPEVSRHHLRITRDANGFTIDDLGSTNGTFINGQRITAPKSLSNGDMVGLGETVTLGYERARQAPAAAPPPQQAYPGAQSQQPAPSQSPQPAQQQQPAEPQYSTPAQQQPAAQPQNQQAYYEQPSDYNAPQAPPGVGYDYDPYAVREEEPRSALRWFAIGCLVLSLFCCCSIGIGLVLIDVTNSWYTLPIIKDIAPLLEQIAIALGF